MRLTIRDVRDTSNSTGKIGGVFRATGIVATCMLVALAVTYSFTYEPAPRIAIRWADIQPARRQQLERRFLLVNPAPDRDRIEYDLLDTSRTNIEALVREPDVADTDRVSRDGFTVPLDVPYGASWMWAANRIPVLRTPGVIPAIVTLCVAAVAVALARELRRRIGRGATRGERGAHLLDS
jgi:hypothetical protein